MVESFSFRSSPICWTLEWSLKLLWTLPGGLCGGWTLALVPNVSKPVGGLFLVETPSLVAQADAQGRSHEEES